MEQILQVIRAVPHSDWVAVGAWLTTAAGQSFVLQLLKHFNPKLEGKVAFALHSFLTTVTALAAFIVMTPQLQVIPTVGKYWAILMGLTTLWYKLATSPFYNWLTNMLNDAESFRAVSAPQPTSVAEKPPQQYQL